MKGVDIRPLIAPNSIALVGASCTKDSFGRAMLNMALSGSFKGKIYPVNPKYTDGLGCRFYSTLSDLPETVEHVVLAVANERLENALINAIEHKVKAVTIFADCNGQTHQGLPLKDRLKTIAKEAGILLCGPNSMGFHNLDHGLRVTPFPSPKGLIAGSITAILQSGSVMGALAHNDRRLRFNLLVSTGSEYAVTAADYINWSLSQSTTKVIGLFLESVRDPEYFLSVLRRARDQNIPVVLLKVGRTEMSRQMALSHTGAKMGEHLVFATVMKSHGVHLVETIDEMVASLHLFSQGRIAASGHIASIHDSGGERELLVDICSDENLEFAQLSTATKSTITPLLPAGLKAENPLDAWGSGRNAKETFLCATNALVQDENVAAVMYVLDWRQDYYLHEMHEEIIKSVARATQKPIAAVSNYALTFNQDLALRLSEQNIPLLEGTKEATIAFKNLLNQRDASYEQKCEHEPHTDLKRIIQDIKSKGWIGEGEGFRLLGEYGISTPLWRQVDNVVSALSAAFELGYPVVMKTAMANIAHKTEVGGVKLNIANKEQARIAYTELSSLLGPDVIVAQMVSGEIEWMIGIVNDRDFGPAVMISPGGIMVELLEEKVILMPPFSAKQAALKLQALKATKLLTGYRGQEELAFDALCKAASNVSRLACDLVDYIEEMDINPILISSTKAVALDVMLKIKK